MAPNVMAYPAILLGVLQAGGVVVNINPLYTPRELELQILDSTPRFLFVLENFAEPSPPSSTGCSLKRIILIAPGDLLGAKGHLVNFVSRRIKKAGAENRSSAATTFRALVASDKRREAKPVAADRRRHGRAAIYRRHDRIGQGRGFAASQHCAPISNNASSGSARLIHRTNRSLMVTALPLYHIFALTACFWFQMRMGGGLPAHSQSARPRRFRQDPENKTFTSIAGVNTLYNALADHPGMKKVDFSEVNFCVAGGMAMQAAVARKVAAIDRKGDPRRLRPFGNVAGALRQPRRSRANSAARSAIPCPRPRFRSAMPRAFPSPKGEPGEICARGPQVMAGYWDRPMATEAVMTTDGYFRTGDVGMMLPDGQIKIVDRLKDMIIVSGFNVYPNEIEEVIVEHPKVREAAVIGRPDMATGEEVVAFVVPREPGPDRGRFARILPRTADRLQNAARIHFPRRIAENQCRQGVAPQSQGQPSLERRSWTGRPSYARRRVSCRRRTRPKFRCTGRRSDRTLAEDRGRTGRNRASASVLGFRLGGGQALARYLLDNPGLVAGKSVLDFASGSGLVAIAAAKSGASHVEACDIDDFALSAMQLNAQANDVVLKIRGDDMIGRDEGWEVVLAGDVSYERDMAQAVTDWLQTLSERGALVLIGDPGRAYLARERLESVADYRVPVTRALEDCEIKRSQVWRFRADS